MSVRLISFFYHPNFFGGRLESDQLLYETLRLYVEKAQFFTFPPYFCTSAIGISFSYKYMKPIVKSHQSVKFMKKLTSLIGPGIMTETIYSPQNVEYYGVYCFIK